MTSLDAISQVYDDESEKLHSLIRVAYSTNDLSLHEIVEMYYQVMNVSSMSQMLKQQGIKFDSSSSVFLNKINTVEKLISEKFDSDVHPKTLKKLSYSISETTKKLQSINPGQKPKEEIESEAKLFEELRQKMSTKEFVEQYDTGLHHD